MKKILIYLFVLMMLVSCSKTSEETKEALTTDTATTQKLLDIKKRVEASINSDKIVYQDMEKYYTDYTSIVGTYDNTTAFTKYFELKKKFLDSGDNTLITYANSKEFEKNLFFMFVLYTVDKGTFKDATSVIISELKTLKVTVDIKNAEGKYVEAPFSTFNISNANTAGTICFGSIKLNAKNSFGAYVGVKFASQFTSTTSPNSGSFWILL